ncbi:excisionase family DNA-binding protein [Streptomyces roseolus]|uniref:excisionase family DNA-binding protein n=1 Tax=Streptomyces roseolus TaxID=67358 RepID=UPI0036532D83
MPHASRQQPSENTAEAGDRPLDEVELLTVQETAQALRVPMVTVHRLVQKGQLPAIRTGRSFRVPAYAVHKYLRKAATDRNDRNTNG